MNRFNVQIWIPEPFEFCGEPIFVPRMDIDHSDVVNEEQNGYLISLLFNGKTKTSDIAIFLADQQLSRGPIARIKLKKGVPHGNYGYFCSSEESAWSAEQINRRVKLADKMEAKGNRWNEVKSDFSGLGLRLDDFEDYFGQIL
jgi:all-trans-8'-apo-beta-carotenal 15,15'-oxygenase